MSEHDVSPRCAASRPVSENSGPAHASTPAAASNPQTGSTEGMVLLDGGAFVMGTDDEDGFPADGERSVREVATGNLGFRCARNAN